MAYVRIAEVWVYHTTRAHCLVLVSLYGVVSRTYDYVAGY